MQYPTLDVIIVNWNAGRQLLDCLKSFKSVVNDKITLSGINVVDNASTDGSLELLDGDLADLPLKIIRNNKNRGFAAACNQGAWGSRANFLLFLNPDTRLSTGCLERPVSFFTAIGSEEVGIVGVQLVNGSGNIARNCARRPRAAAMIGQSLGFDRIFPAHFPPHFLQEWNHDTTRIVDQVMGAFMMIRRPLFETLSGFDERFFVYFEDLDLALRARALGWTSVYLATAQAFHRGRGTTDAAKAKRLFYVTRSRILFSFKHFSRPAAIAVATSTIVLEPLARVWGALTRGSVTELPDIARGFAELWAELPRMLYGGDVTTP
jgi:GT2 family glycosyltransferase